MDLPYRSDIPCLGIVPKERKSVFQRHSWTPNFIATLLTMAKVLNQPFFPRDRQVNKENVVSTYSDIIQTFKKRNLAICYLDDVMLSQISQTQKDKYYIITHV